MAVKNHPMSQFKGTQQGKDLMSQVRGHKKGMPMKETPVGESAGDAANTAGSQYADPGYQSDKRKRYPLDTPEHVRAAASYFGMGKNRAKYSAAQQKEIQGRIDAAKGKHGIGSDETEAALNFVARKKKRK